jgi:hydrogenase-1 operon protein HyaF
VRDIIAAMPPRPLPLEHIVPPDGTMNVMGVLSEIRHVAGAWRMGAANHVMNFTLLPMTEPDVDFLAKMLGQGPVRFASGGYGAARIIATAFARVWAVQYLNSMGVVILDTLEIGDVPSAARAALEDFEDSATRLAHILTGDLQ